ncbi:MAG TPA: AsmA family protein, partial [Phenylobacterium sp.]
PARRGRAIKRPSHRTLAIVGALLALLAAAIALFIYLWDWNYLRGPISRYATDKLGRPVAITGDLDVDIFTWNPSATVHGLTVGDPAWRAGGKGKTADVGAITGQIKLMPLLKGDVMIQRLELDKPQVNLFRDAQGRATWDFKKPGEQEKKEPFRMPPVRSFVINDGVVNVRDEKRDFTFKGHINAREDMGGRRGFELRGDGTMNRAPFRALVTGGPLINIQPDETYPFDADIRSGATHVTAKGGIPRPFDLGQFHMDLTATGPDMADIYDLTGLAVPNTPPYTVRGRLVRDEFMYRVTGLRGRVGDSDLSGRLSVDTEPERPMLRGALVSNKLDFDDLGAVFGGAPKTGPGETASAGQKVMANNLAAQQRIFPDATLKVDRMRAMDADVTFRATTIFDAPMKLRSGKVHVTLDNALLRADDLVLGLPKGSVTGDVSLNARGKVPVTALDLRLNGARLEDLVPTKISSRAGLTGGFSGRIKLTGAGDSVHKAMDNANGEAMVVVPNGTIREAFAELLGINVTKALGLLMTKDMSQTPIRCGVAHFNASGGVLTANNIVFDTGPVLATGSGTIDLGTERMAFRIKGHGKEFRLVRLLAPITLTGPIRSPKPGIEPGAAIAQGGIAVALGALVNPLAAILPFIDPGLAKDANCSALIASGGTAGVPVKAAKR